MKKYWDNFLKHRFLLSELVKKGIKLKYRRSYLGIIWSLIEPIMSTIVLTIVFGTLFQRSEKTFALYVISGRLLYQFFNKATHAGAVSIRHNAGMIKKVYVPKYFYPLSSTLFNFIIFLISLLAMIPIMIYARTAPTIRFWHIIPALGYLILLSVGTGLILATINVFFRDIEYLWNVILLVIMYCSAIFYYPERLLESRWWFLLKFHPLYCIINLFRSGVLGYYATWWDLLFPMFFSIAILIIGVFVFKKYQDEFILHI